MAEHVGSVRIDNPAPLDYVTPDFPSLYWPFDVKPGAAQYLYFTKDIWRFTLFWTLMFYGVVHTAALVTGLANRVPLRLKQIGLNFNGKLTFGLSIAYLAVSAFQGLLAGTCIGFLSVKRFRFLRVCILMHV